jgi:hypothetical protein
MMVMILFSRGFSPFFEIHWMNKNFGFWPVPPIQGVSKIRGEPFFFDVAGFQSWGLSGKKPGAACFVSQTGAPLKCLEMMPQCQDECAEYRIINTG